jgi:NAD(P)H-dependent FMN reductase
MKLLALAVSLRAGSWTRKLIAAAVEIATGSGVEVDLADFHDSTCRSTTPISSAEGSPPVPGDSRGRSGRTGW